MRKTPRGNLNLSGVRLSRADRRIITTVENVVESLRNTKMVPNPATRYKRGGSTGHLAYLGLRYAIRNGAIEVYMDTNIIPYVPYTNEPWIAKRWNGRKNPNEGWWQRFANEVILLVAIKLKGDIK